MSYQPKPGDCVTSPLLVGEWVVGDNDVADLWWVYQGDKGVLTDVANLSPVAPPMPAEPPVGSVVWARGQLWLRTDENGPWHWATAKNLETWEFLAAASDLSPVVAVSQVADWLRDYDADVKACLFVERFGWPDE